MKIHEFQAKELLSRFGVSVRGTRPAVWWDDRGTVRRRPLAGDWLGDLERIMTPSPKRQAEGKLRTRWEGELNRAGVVTPLTAHFLADESGVGVELGSLTVAVFAERIRRGRVVAVTVDDHPSSPVLLLVQDRRRLAQE